MPWKLEIPQWIPHRINEWEGRHWRVKHRLKREDRDFVAAYALQQQIPKATRKRTVSLALTLVRMQGLDPDAFWKSTLDALVACGLLVDDSQDWVNLGPVVIAKGKQRGTIITLSEEE